MGSSWVWIHPAVRGAAHHLRHGDAGCQGGRDRPGTRHPCLATATFRLTKPIDLGATVDSTGPVPVATTGDLTLHGTTRNVTVPLTAQRNSAGIQLSGQIPVTFADYGIPNPSIGSFVTTDDHGQAEILLNFTKA